MKSFTMDTAIGQHILCNPMLCQTIVDKAEIKPSDTVLEVGPGTGNLTVKIIQHGKKCIAVEKDPRMGAELLKMINNKKLELVQGDVIKVNLPYFDLCISNTPYQISSPLLFKLLATRPLPRVCVLMFQREFAMRCVAQPGDPLYCRLSVNLQFYAKVSHLIKVGRNSFKPPPKVESSVIKIIPFSPPPSVPFNEFDGLLRICFNRKNKTLRAEFTTKSVLSLLERNYHAMNGNDEDINIKTLVTDVLTHVGLSDARAGKMAQEDFLRLLDGFRNRGIYFN